jgi:hypothetical protein
MYNKCFLRYYYFILDTFHRDILYILLIVINFIQIRINLIRCCFDSLSTSTVH